MEEEKEKETKVERNKFSEQNGKRGKSLAHKWMKEESSRQYSYWIPAEVFGKCLKSGWEGGFESS